MVAINSTDACRKSPVPHDPSLVIYLPLYRYRLQIEPEEEQQDSGTPNRYDTASLSYWTKRDYSLLQLITAVGVEAAS